MAGPVASILLPSALVEADCKRIGAEVSRESNHLIEAWFPGHDCRRFVDDFTQEHRTKIAATFGFAPAGEIDLLAVVSGLESHRLLGQFAVELAERYGSIIDFRGALWPPTPGVEWRSHMNTEWHHIKFQVTAILSQLPGQIIALPYTTADDTQWAVHYSDATFLRAWLQHPHFHMIK